MTRPADIALGFTDPAEDAEARRLMAEDPLFREEVARLRGTAALLESLDRSHWRPEPAPPLPPPTVPAPRRRRRLRLVVPAGAMAAAAASLAILLGGTGPAGRTIALRPVAAERGTATLTVVGGEAHLHAEGLPPSGPHDYYEAWLADRRGRMVTMGTFRVDARGRADAAMPVAVRLADYRIVDVSLEPDDGDPAHSSRSVLRGRLS